jgi:secondary thiamine-phosphate synthase enzyme
MERISVKTNKRVEMIDITAEIQRVVGRCGLSSGVCVVFCPHTTAGLTINENADPDVRSDMVSIVNKIVPAENGYKHAEGNSDSHMKASLFGPSLSVIVENGGLQLGSGRRCIYARPTARGPGCVGQNRAGPGSMKRRELEISELLAEYRRRRAR